MSEDPAAPPVPEAVFEADTLADLAGLFGPERLARLLAGLDAEIVRRLQDPDREEAHPGANAHILVSVSGTLGFMSLSRACAALERAILAEADPAGPLLRARAEAARARQAIAGLLRGEGQGGAR